MLKIGDVCEWADGPTARLKWTVGNIPLVVENIEGDGKVWVRVVSPHRYDATTNDLVDPRRLRKTE